jgi:hypothetical protein
LRQARAPELEMKRGETADGSCRVSSNNFRSNMSRWIGSRRATRNTHADSEREGRLVHRLFGTWLTFPPPTKGPFAQNEADVLFNLTLICSGRVLLPQRCIRRLLPKNPCNIASIASLLEGSGLLKAIPSDREYLTNKQMKEQGTFKGCLLSLGWWVEIVVWY